MVDKIEELVEEGEDVSERHAIYEERGPLTFFVISKLVSEDAKNFIEH